MIIHSLEVMRNEFLNTDCLLNLGTCCNLFVTHQKSDCILQKYHSVNLK